MEIDKKTCVICKKTITNEKEYICTECYNENLEQLKTNKLYEEVKNLTDSEWLMGIVLLFALLEIRRNNYDNQS